MFMLLHLPVLTRNHPGVQLEELVEGRLVREVQLEDDFLDRHVGILQHVLGLQDQERVDPVRGGTARDVADEL